MGLRWILTAQAGLGYSKTACGWKSQLCECVIIMPRMFFLVSYAFVGCRATLSSQDLVAHGPAQGTYSWRLMANGLIACLLCWVFIMSMQWKTGKHYCRRSTRLPGTLICSTLAKPVPCFHIAAHVYSFLHAFALWSFHLHRILTARLLPGHSKTMVHRTLLHVFHLLISYS